MQGENTISKIYFSRKNFRNIKIKGISKYYDKQTAAKPVSKFKGFEIPRKTHK